MNNAYLARARQQISDPQILAVVTAKRAKQLALGGRPMIKCDSENLLDVALLEIAKVFFPMNFREKAQKRRMLNRSFRLTLNKFTL